MTLYQILASAGYPVSEIVFPPNVTPTLPFILYGAVRSNNFIADDKVYKNKDVIQIRLVSDGKWPNKTAIAALETALTTNGIIYEMVDDFYVETENTYETIYEIGVMR